MKLSVIAIVALSLMSGCASRHVSPLNTAVVTRKVPPPCIQAFNWDHADCTIGDNGLHCKNLKAILVPHCEEIEVHQHGK